MNEKTQINPATTTKVPWNPVAALLLVIALYFIAPIISGLLISIYPGLRGWSEAQLQAWLTNAVTAQFWYVLITELLTIGGLLLYLRHWKTSISAIGLKRPRLRDAGIGLIAYPVYFILFAVAVLFVSRFVPGVNIEQEQQLGFDNVQGTIALILTFISLVVLPPLVEEILVRGFLYSSLRKKSGFIVAALLTSLIFAVAHLPEGGDGGPLYIAAIDTFLLSIVLCFIREKTGSLWAGIVLHAIKNGVAYVSLFILAAR